MRSSNVDERLGILNRMVGTIERTLLTATTNEASVLEDHNDHGVFTYAVFEALDHSDVNKNGLIEVSELAGYIDQKVPDYSFEISKLWQIPQRSIVGNNFLPTNRAEILAGQLRPSPHNDVRCPQLLLFSRLNRNSQSRMTDVVELCVDHAARHEDYQSK